MPPCHHDFILHNTRLQRPPLVPELQLYLGGEVMPLWERTQQELNEQAAPPPLWAYAWVGGQALARYLLDHPEEATGKRVLDLACGSGMCAIAAMKSGAASTLAADIDPFCEEVVALNACANQTTVAFTDCDLLDSAPPHLDLILAGDVCYEEPMAARVLTWLEVAHDRAIRILIGDPNRAYFPRSRLIQLAAYEVPTTRDLEGVETKCAGVYTFPSEP